MHSQYSAVHTDADIADDVKIGPFTTIEAGVRIGKGSVIGPNVSILKGTTIGSHCEIHHGAVIGGKPQDLKYNGEETYVEIGDSTVIREHVTISRGTADKLTTQIGKNCLLMAYVHVAHDCTIGNHCIFSNTVQIAGHVNIHDHVVVAGTAAIHQFVKIGAHAFIAGGALVRKDVPPFTLAAREPLSYAGVNSTGLKRRDFSTDKIAQIHEIYRILFNSGMNLSNALEHIQQELPDTKEREMVLEFVSQSERGIIRGYN